MGHPRVFLNLEKDGRAECPYCDKLFLLDAGAGQGKTA
ncbi:MAG: zinc-finger domain-containing protein [Sphingomonadales bacterium]